MGSGSPVYEDWMNRFFASYYRRRPVNATFIGMHDLDGCLPDFSENGAGDALAEMQDLLQHSRHWETEEPASFSEKMDHRLARGFLEIQMWEYQSKHFHRGNPSLYTGEAAFGVMALFLSEFAPLTERVTAAIQRLEAIPNFLAQAQKTLGQTPSAWTQRAIRECDGALAFLTEGVDLLAAAEGIAAPRLPRAAQKAAAAFVAFKGYLESELRYRPADHYGCGEEALALYLRRGHFLDMDADEIARYAKAQMVEAAGYLRDHAGDFGAVERQQVLRQLSAIHPKTDQYYGRYREVWRMVHEIVQAKDLLTWPDFPIRYVPRPDWTRKAAPHLYFLFYRSPAAFNRPPVHDYFVTPIDRTMTLEEQRSLLRETNDCVIKLNHVIHHGAVGHHVQNWHAFHSASRIGQIAAVDCAARIAMFCGGTLAEGWACYATDLMSEAGALTPLEKYAEKHSRVRMCARAVVDVGLHQGRLSLEQAARYYEQEADMTPAAALGEAVKNSMFPGAALMYLVGNDGIHRLRQEMAALHGNRFTLRKFHDEFLSYGSVPVALISEDMKLRAAGAPPGDMVAT